MVTVKKILNIIKSDESEAEKIIDAMTEQDAKALLKSLTKALKASGNFGVDYDSL